MNKFLFFLILILVFCGCAGAKFENSKDRFVNTRNYDVGRSVDRSYAMPPAKISSYNEKQDKYLFEGKDGCQWVYYVNKETKVVESWEYVSSPDKCSLGIGWFNPW
jgi:uncharacterized protein YxeA